MAEKVEFQVVTTGTEESAAKLEKVGAGFKSVQDKAKEAGLTFAAIGGIGVAAISGWIKSAQDAEIANKMLEHAVVDVSHGTEKQLVQMNALAEQLAKNGVLEDDANKRGLAQLSTFGLSTQAVMDLGQSMSDLAVNQFGISASGEQVEQSANMISKALRGEFGVLEKSGIRFSEAQKKMIEFGNETEKVKAVNEGFAQNLKFTNEIAKATAAGGLQNLKNRIGEIGEDFGKKLEPAFTQFISILEPIVTWFEKLDDATKQNIASTTLFVTGFALAGAAIAAVIVFITPMVLAVGALSAAVGLLAAAWNGNWGGMRDKVMEVWNTIIPAIASAWDWIQANVVPKVQQFIDDIKARVAPIVQFFQDNWGTIQQAFSYAWDYIKFQFTIFWEAFKLIFSVAWEVFAGMVKVALSLFHGDWEGAWTAIKEMFSGVWNAMYSFVKGILKTIVGFVGGSWDEVKKGFQSMSDTATKIWSDFWNGLKGIVENIVGAIKAIIDGVIGSVNTLVNGVKSLANAPTALGNWAGNNIVNAINGHHAMGGFENAGSPYVVGERGPEIFVPNTSGRIIPNNEIGGTQKNVVLNFNFSGPVSDKDVAIKYMNIAIRELQLHSPVI